MPKDLTDMSLQELWELFPITFEEHQESWEDWYEDERLHLEKILLGIDGLGGFRINHVGSTAIKGICAKPIVDILVELPSCEDLAKCAQRLSADGYIRMSESPDRISFNKGYTPQGYDDRVFHIHLRITGDNGEIYFRDYLNRNPKIAKEYEALKMALWDKHRPDRDAYTEGKTEFVTFHTEKARASHGLQRGCADHGKGTTRFEKS